MKVNKKNAGAFIGALILLFLFFSRTIYTYHMPVVSGTRPFRGALSQLEISNGIARWGETETIIAPAGGTVGLIHVREGDRVEEGDILFEMDYDLPEAQRRYQELRNNVARLELDIENTRARLNSIRTALAEEQPESLEVDAVQESIAGGQGGLILLEINRAHLGYLQARLSHELGLMSRNDFRQAENSYLSLLFRYEAEAEELEHALRLKQLDLFNLSLNLEAARELLESFRNHRQVLSPVSGIIHNVSAERGKFFAHNAPLASIGIGEEFIVEARISLDNNFVNPGESYEMRNANHLLRGMVQRIRPEESYKTVFLVVSSGMINDGETFEVIFEKTGAATLTLVPSRAIHQDSDGYFLYQIRRRRGIMGEEYVVERLNIYIGESDHSHTSVVRGISFFDPLVLVSDRILSPGMSVALRNPEDFFEQ
ncbi:MAG: HlyD family efflux transporter periplasmic adaptor subunit [Treponema sp.]|nr:HlyD family efflux transporter periplasmic adaptor subunit [Treponema sp.]